MKQSELFKGYTEDKPDTVKLYDLLIANWRDDIPEQIAMDGCAVYSKCTFKGKNFDVVEIHNQEVYLNDSLIYSATVEDVFNEAYVNKIKAKVKASILSNKYQLFI